MINPKPLKTWDRAMDKVSRQVVIVIKVDEDCFMPFYKVEGQVPWKPKLWVRRDQLRKLPGKYPVERDCKNCHYGSEGLWCPDEPCSYPDLPNWRPEE